ncbi:MAG TPA: anthranilate synthase component I [Piscirickettsiaceae bacterium]|nr:anthranilate synthase component I [Piscirickettsiaceae bacterium]HIQ39568.1 anthranilate synthase component I [Sulfurivirga caldicuralii]
MQAADFYALTDYDRVPLVRTLLSDFDTPLSVWHKLVDGPWAYLLESVQGGEKWGRYSIIGLPSRERIEVRGHRVRQWVGGQVVLDEAVDDPLAWIEAYRRRVRVAERPGLPRFHGGLVGYFGYDTVRLIEPRLADSAPPHDPLGTPDILLLRSEEVVVFDNLSGQVHLIVHADPNRPGSYEAAQARLDALQQKLRQPLVVPQDAPLAEALDESQFVSSFGEEAFKAAVERIKDYILAGDVMQVVISQRLSVPYDQAHSMDLYRALRHLNPSPYMYYLDLDDHQVVGSSPEILVRLEGDEVTVRPIAGTRKRGATPEQDRALEAELLNDPKEIAEHLMLIDLGRNDVGRIAELGSVKLTDKMVIERYSHVMHIVSNVTGRLKAGLGAMDVLKATFPAGTVSGAPKIRAMEIIDELEPVRRGIYAGAVGYLGWHGNMDTAIAIRTAVLKDNRLHIQAGAGVVADSIPELEWKETMNKARALFRAAQFVSQGLKP